MSIREIQGLNKKRKISKISNILKKSWKFDLCRSGYDLYWHKACQHIKKHENIQILNTSIDLAEIFPKLDNFDTFSEIDCGFHNKEMKWDTEYIKTQILKLCEENKTIFIIIDLNNYFVIPEYNFNENGFHKFHEFINTGQIHSVSMIFYPTGKNTYDVFYINSHGRSSFTEKTYELKVSNTRIKEYKFNSNVNHIFVKQFLKFLQSYFNTHKCNPNFSGRIKLKYDNTKKHNYYGCNLQNGDFYGVCFMYPLIIWYYFNRYYHQIRHVGKRKTVILPSVSEMLHKKQLDLFVKTCFLDFSEEFGHLLLSRSDKYLDKFIEEKRTLLIKQILDKFVCFITQTNIQKNL